MMKQLASLAGTATYYTTKQEVVVRDIWLGAGFRFAQIVIFLYCCNQMLVAKEYLQCESPAAAVFYELNVGPMSFGSPGQLGVLDDEQCEQLYKWTNDSHYLRNSTYAEGVYYDTDDGETDGDALDGGGGGPSRRRRRRTMGGPPDDMLLSRAEYSYCSAASDTTFTPGEEDSGGGDGTPPGGGGGDDDPPEDEDSDAPTIFSAPTGVPSANPSGTPSTSPAPTLFSSADDDPSADPSAQPSAIPSSGLSIDSSAPPSAQPSAGPSTQPSGSPTEGGPPPGDGGPGGGGGGPGGRRRTLAAATKAKKAPHQRYYSGIDMDESRDERHRRLWAQKSGRRKLPGDGPGGDGGGGPGGDDFGPAPPSASCMRKSSSDLAINSYNNYIDFMTAFYDIGDPPSMAVQYLQGVEDMYVRMKPMVFTQTFAESGMTDWRYGGPQTNMEFRLLDTAGEVVSECDGYGLTDTTLLDTCSMFENSRSCEWNIGDKLFVPVRALIVAAGLANLDVYAMNVTDLIETYDVCRDRETVEKGVTSGSFDLLDQVGFQMSPFEIPDYATYESEVVGDMCDTQVLRDVGVKLVITFDYDNMGRARGHSTGPYTEQHISVDIRVSAFSQESYIGISDDENAEYYGISLISIHTGAVCKFDFQTLLLTLTSTLSLLAIATGMAEITMLKYMPEREHYQEMKTAFTEITTASTAQMLRRGSVTKKKMEKAATVIMAVQAFEKGSKDHAAAAIQARVRGTIARKAEQNEEATSIMMCGAGGSREHHQKGAGVATKERTKVYKVHPSTGERQMDALSY